MSNYDTMANICQAVPLWKRILFCAKSPQQIVKDIQQIEDDIVVIANDPKYNVVRVFVTFNTEHDQRAVLSTLSVAKFKRKYAKEEHKFEGKVLKILEPDEPLAIRWLDLQDSSTVSKK
jgi:hypothetical protein